MHIGCCVQNGERTAFAMLDDCQQMAAAGSKHQGTGRLERLQVCLNEGVVALEPRGSGQGVVVITERRRYEAAGWGLHELQLGSAGVCQGACGHTTRLPQLLHF